MKRLTELLNYRDMISGMVKRDLRGRYKGSFLGFLWNYVNPLCQMLVYYIVFSNVFNPDIEKFHIFLISGLMPWNFFAEALSQGSGCIFAHAEMTKKIYFPREVLPIATVSSRFINLLLTLIVGSIIIIFSGGRLTVKAILFLPIVLVLEYLLALAFVLLLSSLNVYFRDIEYMTGVIMMAWIWVTPIMYTYSSVPDGFKRLIDNNPMTGIIRAYQSIFYNGAIPDIYLLVYPFMWTVVLLIVGEIVFVKLSKHFSEEL